MPSTRSTKKQTRLAFTPIPSSSPQTAQLPTQIRPCEVAVRYGALQTPAKRQRVEDSESQQNLPSSSSHIEDSFAMVARKAKTPSPLKRSGSFVKRGFHLLPTPEASSQVLHRKPVVDDDVDSIFSDSSLPSLETALTNSTKSRHPYTPAKSSGGKSQAILGDDASPSLNRHNQQKQSRTSNIVVVSSDEGSDDEHSQRPISSGVHGRSGRDSSTARSPTQMTPTSSKTIRSSIRRMSSNRDSPTSKRLNHKPTAKSKPLTNNKRRSARLSARATSPILDDSSSATEVERVSQKSSQKAMRLSSEDDSDVVLTGSRPRVSGAFLEASPVEIGESEDSDEDAVISPTKRKRLVRPGQPSQKKVRRQEDEDIEEDLEILRDTELHQDRTRGRTVDSKKDAARKHLEKLKALRENRNTVELSPDSETFASLPPRVSDSDFSSQASDASNSEISITRGSFQENLDEYEEDFVVDDGEDTVGVPAGLEEIPLEFTRHAHKKAKAHFKDAVEWMVHKKLNPAFARNDPVYRVAFRKLEDEVKGYAGSKFISAAWIGDFARALKARPEFFEVGIPYSPINYNHCAACNRTNHPAKFMITFGGKPYHPETLEKLADEDDEEDGVADSSDDGKSRDALGDPLPGTDKEFFVGRFCKANAAIAHSLLHWRFHLNEWVLDWLTNAGFITPEKIVERENWSIKKRSDYANKVVDEMAEKGEIKALYRDFKINLDEARNYKPPRFRRFGG